MINIKEKLQLLPDKPGCYLMKDVRNEIIYVGKAKNLKNRVSSYFSGAHNFKTSKLVQNIIDFDYIITLNEKESLLLEYNLIKKYKPRFNIIFMDDKSYPYIKISNELYPTIKVVHERNNKDKKSTYFGPFPEAGSARLIVKRINEMFPLKKCKTMPKKVCLYYHLNQCLGMCEYPVEVEEYHKLVDEVKDLLSNHNKKFFDLLNQKMSSAAEVGDYENAAKYRDEIKSLTHILEKQSIVGDNYKDIDVVNYYQNNGFIAIQILMIRQQQLFDNKVRVFEHYGNINDDFNSYLNQYIQKNDYDVKIVIPDELNTFEFENVISFKKSKYDNLLLMAKNNAKEAITRKLRNINLNDSYIELSEILKHKCNRIEIFDNSHISGSSNVSAMVVVQYGMLSKKDYRTYKLQENLSDTDSFSEVLYRRYQKSIIKDNLNPCDLLIVDGGIQQINIAKKTRDSLNLTFMIIGLVKNKYHKTDKVMLEDGNILDLTQHKNIFNFLTLLQDEVHRFVLKYHHKLREKKMKFSLLDDCDNIGNVRKQKLLKYFNNIENLKKADLKEIQSVIGKSVGLNLYKYLHEV